MGFRTNAKGNTEFSFLSFVAVSEAGATLSLLVSTAGPDPLDANVRR